MTVRTGYHTSDGFPNSPFADGFVIRPYETDHGRKRLHPFLPHADVGLPDRAGHRCILDQPDAFFFTCMSVTHDGTEPGCPLYVDPSFEDPDRPPARLRVMEENHTAAYSLEHFLKLVPGMEPVGIAFFRGRQNTADLNTLHRLIMRFAMFALPEIKNGDDLDPVVMRTWAEEMFGRMKAT